MGGPCREERCNFHLQAGGKYVSESDNHVMIMIIPPDSRKLKSSRQKCKGGGKNGGEKK